MEPTLPSDQLKTLIARRFDNAANKAAISPAQGQLNHDFFVDLLCVFHHPEQFKATDFMSYPLPVVVTYLRKTHQYYLGKNLEELDLAIATLAQGRKDLASLQATLALYMQKLKAELTQHIQEEEESLFPYIDALLAANGNQQFTFGFKQKVQLIDFLLHHDDKVEESLRHLVAILERKVAQYNDSFAYRMLVNRLKVFELDLRIHSQLEEEVLMPMALTLEKKVLNNPNLEVMG